jgi:hypothetical protein
MTELPSQYHRNLPYGERLSAAELIGDPLFPFEGDLQVVPLADPELPEPPRAGEPGGKPCVKCADPETFVIWRDDQWSVKAFENHGLPFVAVLEPREHYRLDNLPPELTATLGGVIQRVSGAISRLEAVGRTHFSRWGDGSEHFHLWFLARPLGQMQLRGAMLAIWDDLLPNVPSEQHQEHVRLVAAALAEGGGEAVELPATE